MALLRSSIQLLTRSVRTFSAEARVKADWPGFKGGVRLTPRQRCLNSDLTVNERLKANADISREEWTRIRKEILAKTELEVSESTVDMAIVHLCEDNQRAEKAMEYLEYLWDGDEETNLSSMIHYLKLCSMIAPNETQTRYLLEMYNTIREKYPVMDAMTAEFCILGISRTDRWKDSFELVEIINLSCTPRSMPYTAIIRAAFDNNEPEIGWEYLRKCLEKLKPANIVYTAYLNYCTRNFKGDELEEEISKMFQFWGDLDVRPYVEVIAEYEKVLQGRGWVTAQCTIRDLGSCTNCDLNLSPLKVSPEQHRKLTTFVRDRMIIGKDVYRKTNPEEFRKFMNFIERSKPYDIVIDGLNISYSTRTNMKQNKSRPDGSQLTNVVRLCVDMGKRVFVLGRKHMYRWPKLDFNFIKEHGSIFLAEDISADDPYLLYATLVRGPTTLFVSKDLMRQHKFLIEDFELAKTFKYWQMAHQLYPIAVTTNRGPNVRLRLPPAYLPVAQRNDNGWHVPFTNDSSMHPPPIYEPPRTWVCLQKNPPTSSDSTTK